MAVVGRDAADFIVGVEQCASWADKAAVVCRDDAANVEIFAKSGGQQLFAVGVDNVGAYLQQGIAEGVFIADSVYFDAFIFFSLCIAICGKGYDTCIDIPTMGQLVHQIADVYLPSAIVGEEIAG